MLSLRDLLKMFQEIHYWERLMFETPHYAVDVYNKREDLRSLREHVMLVVRDYNRYLRCSSPTSVLFIDYWDGTVVCVWILILRWYCTTVGATFMPRCHDHFLLFPLSVLLPLLEKIWELNSSVFFLTAPDCLKQHIYFSVWCWNSAILLWQYYACYLFTTEQKRFHVSII